MGENGEHVAKWNKPVLESQRSNVLLYRQKLEKKEINKMGDPMKIEGRSVE